MIDLSIVIVSFNTKELTLNCLKSLYKQKIGLSFDVWLVDNASSDGTVEAVKKNFPNVKVIASQKNLGFSQGNNLALKQARSEYYLLLNSDTELYDDSINNLVEFARKNHFDIATCKLVNPDHSLQPNAGALPRFLPMIWWLTGLDDLLKKFFRINSYQERDNKYYRDGKQVGWVSGAVMLIHKKVISKIGYLDSNIFMYGEDVDYCWRAGNAGFKVGWTDQASILHIGGASSTSPHLRQWSGEFKGLIYLYRKYYGWIPAFFLRFLIYLFVIVRVLAFTFIRKGNYAKTYLEVLPQI